MVDPQHVSALVEQLSTEFDALVEERTTNSEQLTRLQKRNEEIDRKLKGIQQALQGFALYSQAQERPTELTKKTQISLAEKLSSMTQRFSLAQMVEGPEVSKSLTECCKNVLRQRGDWMSAIQVREALLAASFDFSNYTSNPLSSIHTTLKRMVPDQLLTESRGDTQMYKWKT